MCFATVAAVLVLGLLSDVPSAHARMSQVKETSSAPAPAARRYHELTKHSPESVRGNGHRLVWENKPTLYRTYPGAETVPLPAPKHLTRNALDAIATADPAPIGSATPLDLEYLSTVLFLSGGVSSKRPSGRGEIRTTAAAGALYPNEMYVVNGTLPDLPAGIYHYDPKHARLTRLRVGDWRAALAAAAVDDRVRRAPATLVLTGLLWRSAWKYRERAYRHLYWDGGMKLAHTLAAAVAAGLPAAVLTGFVDRDVDRLLGIDGRREASIALVPLGAASQPAGEPPVPPSDVPPPAFAPTALSPHPVDYPEALR